MAVVTAPVYVDAPNPTTLRYGLFKVATGPLDLPVHARNGGLQYELSTCEIPQGFDVACKHDGGEKTFSPGWSVVDGDPFVVYASAQCGAVGLDEQRARNLAVSRLLAGEQLVVENIFSLGSFGQAPSLSSNATPAVTLTAAANMTIAVAELEEWLYGQYGMPGIIHVPSRAAAYVMDRFLAERDSAGVWRTNMGTAFSFGNYAGADTAGAPHAAGHTNVYITGQVAIWRTPDSDIFVSPWGTTINRATNQSYMVAEREYVVTFDCFSAVVDVDLTTP